jgi:tetratricopeptide (TPR) repeat protein
MPQPVQPANLAELIAARREAVARNPNDVNALTAFAGLLMQAGKWGQAAGAYRRALELVPDHPGARQGAGRIARAFEAAGEKHAAEGDTAKGVENLRKALALDPASPPATYFKLGALLERTEQTEAALAVLREACERFPGRAAAHVRLGDALRRARRTRQAVEAYRRAIETDPRELAAYRNLADFFAQEGGRPDEALELCGKIRELAPGDPEAIVNEANVLELIGRVREACELVVPLVRAGHRSFRLALAFGKLCQRIKPPSAEALPLLRDELVRPGLGAGERAMVLRALAALCDALGQAEEAFLCMEQAKHIDADRFEDSKEELLAVIERSRACFTRERMARLPRARHGSERPIFIVGMPRSGTSLAEQILASHPAVFGAGELTTIIGLARSALGTGRGYPECFEAWTPERVEEMANYYLRQLHELAPEAARVTDKMPFNFLHLGMIEALFPGARIVHCSRNALDTCVSCYFMEFSPKLSIFNDLATIGRYYRGYRGLMRHWAQVLTLPVFDLRYERLLSEPEQTVRDLVAFCGLEWDDACMKFHETRRVVRTFSYHQVREPLYTRSVGRARAYMRFLGPLVEAIGDELEEGEAAGGGAAAGDEIAVDRGGGRLELNERA